MFQVLLGAHGILIDAMNNEFSSCWPQPKVPCCCQSKLPKQYVDPPDAFAVTFRKRIKKLMVSTPESL